MTWHTSQPFTCSQGPEEAFSLTSYLDTLRSERARLNPTPETCSSNVSVTEHSPASPSGTTLTPLTERRGEAQLTFLQEGSPAKTSVRRVAEPELPEAVRDYGKSMHESLERCGLSLSLPKTHLSCALGDLELSSKIWPSWGIVLAGELSELGTLVRPIKESVCGFWPTPRSCSAMTATITPENSHNPKRFRNLETIVGRRTWPTPQASDNRDRGCMEDPVVKRRIKIGKQVGLTTQVKQTKQSGSLNPMWVEWLMGWPVGWTDLKPLETDKFRNVQPWHSALSQPD